MSSLDLKPVLPQLFEALREQGFCLGVGELLAAQQALAGDLGTPPRL
jgi:hypothetical protein